MDAGQIIESNTPANFFANPQHTPTKLFLSQILRRTRAAEDCIGVRDRTRKKAVMPSTPGPFPGRFAGPANHRSAGREPPALVVTRRQHARAFCRSRNGTI